MHNLQLVQAKQELNIKRPKQVQIQVLLQQMRGLINFSHLLHHWIHLRKWFMATCTTNSAWNGGN